MDLISFLHQIGRLKNIKRAGWVLRGVDPVESVADHSFRVAVMALVFTRDTSLSTDKCIRMALIHDLAEAIVGDITPYDGISPQQKRDMEEQAMQKLLGEIEAPEIWQLWREYCQQETPEARFVHDIDKLEMLLQAHEYEQEGHCLDEFWQGIKMNSEKGRKLHRQLCRQCGKEECA